MRRTTRDGCSWIVSEPSKTEFSFWTEFETIGWEQWTLDHVDMFVTDGSTIIDIGAWAGPVSMWAADRVDCKVIAVEPDPVANDYLNLNVYRNGFDDQITTVEGAIAAHTGTTHIAPHEFGWGSTMSHLSEHGGREVVCWTLPALFDQYHVDPTNVSLVKVDVEGGEAIILEHMGPYCAEQGIPMIVAMHEPWWPRRFDPEWLNGFNVEGPLCGWHSVLCTPK